MIWIPFNKPWSYQPARLNLPPAPKIPEQRYMEVFGTVHSSVSKIALRFVGEALLSPGEKQEIDEARALLARMAEWEGTQPEHQEYRQRCQDVLREQARLDQQAKENSFCGRDLNRPGVLVELEGGRRYVLGDVNNEGQHGVGSCAIAPHEIVVRYMVLDVPGLEVVLEQHEEQLKFRAARDVEDHPELLNLSDEEAQRWGENSGADACCQFGFRFNDECSEARKAAENALDIYIQAFTHARNLTLRANDPK